MCYGNHCARNFRKKKSKNMGKKWIEQRSEQSNVTLLKDLKENNPDDFKNYLRMDDTDFTNLLGK